MNKQIKESEQDLAVRVKKHIETLGWEVFQEVQLEYGGRIADFVCLRGNEIWVIECKKSLTFAVIEQALHWSNYGYCYYASVACRGVKQRSYSRNHGRDYAEGILKEEGIGLINVHEFYVEETIKPKLNRYFKKKWANCDYLVRMRRMLNELHKTWCAAGSAGGGHLTGFSYTCNELKLICERQPGIRLKDAIDEIKGGHYSSNQGAYSGISRALNMGYAKGFYSIYRGRRLCLMPYRLFGSHINDWGNRVSIKGLRIEHKQLKFIHP